MSSFPSSNQDSDGPTPRPVTSQAQTSDARVWTPRSLQPCLGDRAHLLQRLQQDALRRTPGCLGCWARLHLQLLVIRLRQQGERERERQRETEGRERERATERGRERPQAFWRGAGCCRSHKQHPRCALQHVGSGGQGRVAQVSPVCSAPGPAELASLQVLRVRPEPAGDHPLLRI